MSSTAPLALLCGLILGVGLWSIVSATPRLARPRLIDRVAPYLVDVSAPAREFMDRRPSNPLPVLGSIAGPIVERLRWLAAPALGSSAALCLRLRQAASTLTVDAFRARQLAVGVAGVVLGGLVAIGLSTLRQVPLAVAVLMVCVGGVGGFVGTDLVLQRAAKKRLALMNSELPIVLEFLTLSLAAGEGILDSFRRVARTSGGELAREISGLVSSVNSGAPLAESLTGLAAELRLPGFTRCAEQVVGALERGSPLAEVLRAQAQDSREETKRQLIEVAGKKEVAMMIPLVFLILPVTILFAIFPGIFVLQLGF